MGLGLGLGLGTPFFVTYLSSPGLCFALVACLFAPVCVPSSSGPFHVGVGCGFGVSGCVGGK